jgi:hypothetical protein
MVSVKRLAADRFSYHKLVTFNKSRYQGSHIKFSLPACFYGQTILNLQAPDKNKNFYNEGFFQ